MPNPWDNAPIVTPAEANPWDNAPIVKKVKAGKDELPAQNMGNFAAGNLNAGMATILGLPVDTASNVIDLAKAGAGTLYKGATGKVADWAEPTYGKRQNIPGSADNIVSLMRNIGAIDQSAEPRSKGQDYVARALQFAPGAVLGRPSAAQVGRNLGGSTASAFGSQAAHDQWPDRPEVEQLGAMFPGAARYGLEQIPKRVFRGGEKGQQAMQDQMQMLKEGGVDAPSVGQATGKPWIQGAENVSALGPFASAEAAQAQRASGIQAKVKELTDKLAPRATAESAGSAIKEGISGNGGFIDRFKQKQSSLWGKLDPYFKDDTPINVTNLRNASGKLSTPTPGAEETTKALINPKIANINTGVEKDVAPKSPQGLGGKSIVLPASVQQQIQAAASGALPYSAVKELRSRIGGMLSSTELLSDIPKAELKQMYAALTQDLKIAAMNVDKTGKAIKAWNDANKYTKAGHERVDDFLQGITNKITPEQAYAAVMSGTDQGSTKLRTVLKSINSDQRKALAATVIDKIGMAIPKNQNEAGNVFSVDSFMTRYNKLDKSSKAFLFADADTRASMEKIAKAATVLKESGGVNRNPSGTAQAEIKYGAAGSLGALLMTGHFGLAAAEAAGIGANAAFSRSMNNPKFVKWVADSFNIPESQKQQQLIRLIEASKRSTDQEKKDIQTIIDAMNGSKQ